MSDIYAVRITKEASADLDKIFSYIAEDSPRNAGALLERILNDIFSLKTLPHRYKIHQLGKASVDAVRSMPIPPFVVYYRVIEKSRSVQILTVRHGARRKPRRFD